jgi:hypothetical protein
LFQQPSIIFEASVGIPEKEHVVLGILDGFSERKQSINLVTSEHSDYAAAMTSGALESNSSLSHMRTNPIDRDESANGYESSKHKPIPSTRGCQTSMGEPPNCSEPAKY